MCGLGGLPGVADIPDTSTGYRTQHNLSTKEKAVNKKMSKEGS